MSIQISSLPKLSEDQTDSEPEEEEQRHNYKVILSEDENDEGTDEDDNGTGCSHSKETDDDEDYEEVVVKPRHLNELTSLTDKTSPWTSILTDPDLASLDSTEAPDLSQHEDGRSEALKLESSNSSRKHKRTLEKGDSFNGSARDDTDTEGDDERTLQALDERQAEEHSTCSEASADTGPSLIMQHTTNTNDASCSLDDQDSQLQPYP